MEYGSFEVKTAESTSENKWGYFEKAEKEKLEKEANEEKKKEKNEKDSKEKTKDSKERSNSKNKDSKEEPKDSNREAIKQELAREYVTARTEELAHQIETLQTTDPKYHAAIADLALMGELNLKLDDPEAEVEPTVETAYQQIMEDLESIVPKQAEAEPEAKTPLVPLSEDTAEEPKIEINPVLEDTAVPTKLTPPSADSPPAASYLTTSESSSGPDLIPKPTSPSSSTPNTPSPRENISRPEKQNLAVKRLVAKGAIGAFFIGRNLAEKTTPNTPSKLAESIPPSRYEAITRPERQIKRAEQRVREFAVEQVVVEPIERLANKPKQPVVAFEAKPTSNNDAFKLRPISFENIGTKTRQAETSRPNIAPKPQEVAQFESKKQQTDGSTTKLERLNTPDLLKVASNIKIDGKTVRQLFESNKIDYRGLTSIVKEALRGGNIKKAYKKHELGKEAIRGRAIEMRHDDPLGDSTDSNLGANSDTVGSLIEQLRTVNSSETDSKSSKPASEIKTNEAVEISKQKAEAALKKKTLVNISVAAVAAIGIVTALTLFILG